MIKALLAAVAAGLISTSAMAASVTIYADDFDGNVTVYPGVAGAILGGVVAPANGSYAGSNGKSWAGNFRQNNTTGNPAAPTLFTFNNLPAHTALSFDFMLGFIDSWDSTNGSPSPDLLAFLIDGNPAAALTTATASGNVSFYAGGTQIVDNGQIDMHVFFSDDLVDMATAGFLSFAHTASSVTLMIVASGAGWQGGSDESWGVDSFRLTAVTPNGHIPEPATVALLGLGLAGLAASRRRRQ